jgi:hypothetical protein
LCCVVLCCVVLCCVVLCCVVLCCVVLCCVVLCCVVCVCVCVCMCVCVCVLILLHLFHRTVMPNPSSLLRHHPPLTTQGTTEIGDFSHGAAFNLQVTSFVFMCVNAYMCRHNGLEYAKKQAEMRHTNRERLNTIGAYPLPATAVRVPPAVQTLDSELYVSNSSSAPNGQSETGAYEEPYSVFRSPGSQVRSDTSTSRMEFAVAAGAM